MFNRLSRVLEPSMPWRAAHQHVGGPELNSAASDTVHDHP